MASEITTNISVRVANGEFKANFEPGAKRIDQAAIGGHGGIVVVGTSEEDLDLGDISTPGIVAFKNLDSTNYVTYGPNNSGSMVAFGRLEPGETHVIRLGPSGVTLRWQANTAAVKVQVFALED